MLTALGFLNKYTWMELRRQGDEVSLKELELFMEAELGNVRKEINTAKKTATHVKKLRDYTKLDNAASTTACKIAIKQAAAPRRKFCRTCLDPSSTPLPP